MIAANQLNNYCPYEIGDIYLTLRDENPSNRWGGTTWERIKDRFLLAAGDSYAAGGTGGEASHTLTVAEMPSHTHQYFRQRALNKESISPDADTSYASSTTIANSKSEPYTYATGGSQSHNNMPPYLTVHIWKRVS